MPPLRLAHLVERGIVDTMSKQRNSPSNWFDSDTEEFFNHVVHA